MNTQPNKERGTGLLLALVVATSMLLSCGRSSVDTKRKDGSAAGEIAGSARDEGRQLDRGSLLARRLMIVNRWRAHQSCSPAERPPERPTSRPDHQGFDLAPPRAPGLDGVLLSVHVPAEPPAQGGRLAAAEAQINRLEQLYRATPYALGPARRSADIERNFALSRLVVALGIDNAAALEGNIGTLLYLQQRGVRYLSLVGGVDNAVADSVCDDRRTHGGLSAFGRKVIEEMNRLGMIIDVSHVSAEAFDQVMSLTAAPVTSAHEPCCWPTTDDVSRRLKRLAADGGVVIVDAPDEPNAAIVARSSNPSQPLAEELHRMVQAVGADHVGLGTAGNPVGAASPPGGQPAAPNYGALFALLLKYGYDELVIEKVSSANLMRLWRAAEVRSATVAPR